MVISRGLNEPAVVPHSHSPTAENNLNVNNNNNNNSPSSNVYLVGLEFVRQYYTVMNQGPLYLHRFYSEDSSFVHGVSARDSKVVYGQQEIHKRIQSLNFRNCHAKIRQVDSHETLGDGVVIQVTGELSNNGQPMRRFMQTFVLAPQSPKRYYVRNDIFHYQDEVFCDEDVQSSPPVEANLDQEEPEENEKQPSEVKITVPPTVASPPLTSVAAKPAPMVDIRGLTNKNASGNQQPSPALVNDVATSVTTATTTAIINNSNVKSTEVGGQGKFTGGNNTVSSEVITTVSATLPPPPATTTTNQVAASTTSAAAAATTTTPAAVAGAGGDDGVNVVSINRVLEEEVTVVASSGSGPKTYANLFKSSSASSAASTPSAPQQAPVSKSGANSGSGGSPGSNVTVNVNEGVSSPPQVSPQPSAVNNQRQNDKALPPRNPRGPAAGGFRDRDNNRGDRDSRDRNERTERRSERDRLSSRSSNALNDNTDTGSQDGDRRRPVNSYSDAHQLFVGNLPHTVTAAEIREIFSEFGEVADIKIQKPVPKSSGPKVPYFAFVVFEETSSAQAALKKTKISMKMPEGVDRRLNVEEKRSRLNMGSSGGSGGYFNRGDNAANSGHSASNNAGNNSSGGGHGGRGNYGSSYNNDQQQRPPSQPHGTRTYSSSGNNAPSQSNSTRTFSNSSNTYRGSNRGGNDSGRPGRGGGSSGHNSGSNSTGNFQGGRTSPSRNNYNNNTKR